MTTPLSSLLAECRELDAKATPGPWDDLPFEAAAMPNSQYCQGCYIIEWENKEHDAAFIARARELLPQLVRVLEAVEEQLEHNSFHLHCVIDVARTKAAIRRALEGESE